MMRKSYIRIITLLLAIYMAAPGMVHSQNKNTVEKEINIAFILNPYAGDRAGSGISKSPSRMAEGGLVNRLEAMGGKVQVISTVALSEEEEKEYGRWNRFGIANGHLGEYVAEHISSGYLAVGLLNNCSSLMGMLAGCQHSENNSSPLKVGLVWIDAHADFNTPETTLSGMLGGMPVAVAAGDCLTRLRIQSGLDPAIPYEHIVMAGLRDVDPLEQERLDDSGIELITVEDITTLSKNLDRQMKKLSKLTDVIYIHVDMDVLDPEEVSGHSLTVEGGPTSTELANAIEVMFRFEKSSAIGIASLPMEDPGNRSLEAAYKLIESAVKGVKKRGN